MHSSSDIQEILSLHRYNTGIVAEDTGWMTTQRFSREMVKSEALGTQLVASK